MDPTRKEPGPQGFRDLRHALMNPLSVVMGYAQLLAGRSDLNDEARAQVAQILSQANECVRILEAWDAQNETSGPRRETAPASDPAGTPAGTSHGRVLVVDDDPVVCMLTRKILAPEYEVITAKDASEALGHILTAEFDAILLDFNLPGEGGGTGFYEVLQREHPELARRVIFVSGGFVGENESHLLDRSGRPYIQKPFKIDLLRSTIRRMVAAGRAAP